MGSIFKSTKNTRFIKNGLYKYIRSDVPNNISDDETAWLLDNKVTTIIDLRTQEEISAKPCPLSENHKFNYINIPVTGGNAIPKSVDDVSKSYINMIDDTFWEIINTIENASENVLYFCNAGKDRTGVVSAVLLSRMGANREEIINDYMQSKENLKKMLAEFANANKDIDINIITPNEKYISELLDDLIL